MLLLGTHVELVAIFLQGAIVLGAIWDWQRWGHWSRCGDCGRELARCCGWWPEFLGSSWRPAFSSQWDMCWFPKEVEAFVLVVLGGLMWITSSPQVEWLGDANDSWRCGLVRYPKYYLRCWHVWSCSSAMRLPWKLAYPWHVFKESVCCCADLGTP